MTPGLFLIGCLGVPLLTALIVANLPSGSLLEKPISATASVLMLGLTLGIATALVAAPSTGLQFHASISGWMLTPHDAPPTLTLHLAPSWAFAPLLAAACALLLVSTTRSGRSWHVHLQHAALQGSLLAATPEFGLAMITGSTVIAAVSIPASDDSAGRRGRAIVLRWATAEMILWFWIAGFLGVGTLVVRTAAVALVVRACMFPFQGSLAWAARESEDASFFFIPFPAVIWALRWLEPTTLPHQLAWPIATATAALGPAVLALSSGNRGAATAYRLASVGIWPIAIVTSISSAIGLVGFGIAASLCRLSSGWGVVARTAVVIAPTLVIVTIAGSRDLEAADLIGWTAVSLSAISICGGSVHRMRTDETERGVAWREAVLVIAVVAAFIEGLAFGDVPKVDR